MSKPWFLFSPSPAQGLSRGAVPVGTLDQLPLLEQGAVHLLRQWCAGEAQRIALAEQITRALGDARGVRAVNALADLVTLFTRHGRRPLMHHGLDCACLGGDESAFAQMVSAAAAGDHDDAMAFALTMMPAAAAFAAVQTAGPLGLAILAMARGPNRNAAPLH
jgi:hypothetical protein